MGAELKPRTTDPKACFGAAVKARRFLLDLSRGELAWRTGWHRTDLNVSHNSSRFRTPRRTFSSSDNPASLLLGGRVLNGLAFDFAAQGSEHSLTGRYTGDP